MTSSKKKKTSQSKTTGDGSVDDAPSLASEQSQANNSRVTAIIAFVLIWTFAYNLLIKRQGALRAFFQILDTISDDFVMGSLLAIGLGLTIVFVFSATKLYGQINANVFSFAILENLLYDDLKRGNVYDFFVKLLHFRDQSAPKNICPRRVGGILFGMGLIYAMSWIYVIVFSEALFFLSWSSGVNLPITDQNMLLMPTLALAIPFSARVMAYLRYPYAQDYADFMPAAVFGLLMVTALGYLFESADQKFFLKTVYSEPKFLESFLRNGLFLAFIPVFFEACYWLLDSLRSARK